MKTKRILMSVIGVMILAVAVGFFKLAAFGIDPFQVVMNGTHQMFPINFGTLYIIVNAALLVFALLFDRHYIGIATFINLFLLGYMIQFCHETLLLFFPATSMLVRIPSFLFGFVLLCFGCSVYITADLGVSTYDAIALVMAYKWKIGKFKYIRIATDFTCVILGMVLFLFGGGKITEIPTFVGVGTILTAFFMGPLIDFFNRTVCEPFLHR